MSAAKEAKVEMLLRAAATTASWPETPDLRARVVARVSAVAAPAAPVAIPDPRANPPSSRRRVLPALALALVAALAVAGVAGALGFRLPGLEIIRVQSLPPIEGAMNLGSPVPVADAAAIERPRVLLPPAMPEPDAAYVLGAGDRKIVTLAWRAVDGEPALPTSNLSLVVMAIPGSLDETLVTKLLDRGSTVEAVTVDGTRAWWITGAPHELLLLRPDGQAGVAYAALVGDTLVFERDGTVYRLESALGRDRSIEIAESLR